MKFIIIFSAAAILFTTIQACEYSDIETSKQTINESNNSVTRPDEPVKEKPAISEEGFNVYKNTQPPYYGSDPDKSVMLLTFYLFILITEYPPIATEAQAAGTALALLAVVIFLFTIASLIRNHYYKKKLW